MYLSEGLLRPWAYFFQSLNALQLYIITMLRSLTRTMALGFALLMISGMAAFGQRIRQQSPIRIERAATQNRSTQNHSSLKVARLHYSGGGDWYWGASAIPNFLRFVADNSDFDIDTIEYQVSISDPDLFRYPFLFATGHGVISFSPEEREQLLRYLSAGGFLFVNDSYGMETSFRKEIADLFPEREMVELPFEHPIYHCFYDFANGPPKIHEHDNKPARGYAVMLDNRVAVYFLVESDIGDGWEDPQVHNDPPEKREQALKMGLNILTYALLY